MRVSIQTCGAYRMNAKPVLAKSAPKPRHRTAELDGFAALDTCHIHMLRAARALEDLAAAICSSGITPLERAAAAAIAAFYSTTARRHHEDEERHVFPALLASADAQIVQAVLRLRQDHGWLEEDWMELEPHVQAIAKGYGHCDMDLLCQGVEVFVELQRDHIALEESLAYPHAQATLGPAGRREMGREMAARRRAERGRPSSS
jgi:hemerythrin-like domain-containing protein